MTLSFDLKTFADGDILYGDDLNNIQGFIMAEQLRSDIIMHYNDTTYPNSVVASPNKFFSSLKTDFTASIDTAASSNVLWGVNETGSNAAYGWIPFCFVFDDFEDNSLDATKWNTTGTVTESGGTLNVDADSAAISNGASGLDMRSFAGNSEVVMKVKITAGPTSATATLQVSNGSTHITMVNASTTENKSLFVRLVFNKSGQTVDVYTSQSAGVADTLASDNVDISTVTTNWYLRFVTTASGSSVTVETVGYTDGTAGTGTLVFTKTADASANAGLAVVDMQIGTAPTVVFSANSGTNYSTDNCNKMLVAAPTAGTGIRFKVTKALPTTVSATAQNIESVKWFGGVFG